MRVCQSRYLGATMSKRIIMMVGLNMPWPNAEYVSLNSSRSLLDADIIVIHPVLSSLFHAPDHYLGKPCYSDSDSFRIRELIQHWKNQITTAFNAGKTVIVVLVEQEDFHIATGEKNYSGTGRNRSTTRIVEPSNNYAMIPYKLTNIRNATGSKFRREKQIKPIEGYWQSMEPHSQYVVTFEAGKTTSLLTTSDNNITIAASVQTKGNFIFIPDFIYPEGFDDEDQEAESDDAEESNTYEEEEEWTKVARSFAAKFESALVQIDNECRQASEKTSEPDWVTSDIFRLPAEDALEKRISEISSEIANLQTEHNKQLGELDQYKELKSLLYDQGKSLESVVRAALTELGFEVSALSDGESEFDVIFTADGNRFLGEIEGKDGKAINIDKMSQLERNISEDFERDEVSEHALGVLFGNAFRLKPLEERGDFFTAKVSTAAQRNGVRLVRTTDLFFAVKAIRENPDPELKAAFRNAIFEQAGSIVQFPMENFNRAKQESQLKLAD